MNRFTVLLIFILIIHYLQLIPEHFTQFVLAHEWFRTISVILEVDLGKLYKLTYWSLLLFYINLLAK